MFSKKVSASTKVRKNRRARHRNQLRRTLLVERLDSREVLSAFSALGGLGNSTETVQTTFSADQLASALVGPGVTVSNATFMGNAQAKGSFNFNDPAVVGFGQGILLSSGNAADVVGPNAADSTSTDFMGPGDADLTALAGYDTHDASVLEFDFVPTANQVVFNYSFASDEYPEWVNTPFNDVFAFYVNGTDYATVRQVAGDPNSPFVPVAVNNINQGNPLDPSFVAARPDLFRPNYVDPNGGPSAINLELDGITQVLTFQAPVTPGVTNHMKLAIADASDGIYDSAVFIQAGSLVSNENPVATSSVEPPSVATPLSATVVVEGEDPNNLPLTYTVDWGDGTTSGGPLDSPTNESEKTLTCDHNYSASGDYVVKITVSNGTLSSTSTEDIHVGSGSSVSSNDIAPVVTSDPLSQTLSEGQSFTLTASATGDPAPKVQWQVSYDYGLSFTDISGATSTTYSDVASLANDGALYQAVFTNAAGTVTTSAASLNVIPLDITAPDAPGVSLASDSGALVDDAITNSGVLSLTGIEVGATVEYSLDGGATWQASFTPVEGENDVLVCQTDQAGNMSAATALSFKLDTVAPTAPVVTLTKDSGVSAADHITNVGTLSLSGVETGAAVEYSIDGGITWTGSFAAQEGVNSVLVHQVDVAGNVGDAGMLTFTLDTTAPQLNPTLSSGSQPILVNAKGVVAAANATDVGGIASQSAGAIDTTTAGKKSVTCAATDLAGNSASISLPYLVGYSIVNVTPLSGSTIKKSATSIPVSFQLRDANGVLSNQAATALLSKITVTFDSLTFSSLNYNQKTKTFSISLKPGKLTVGNHMIGIKVVANGVELAMASTVVKVV